MVVKIEKHEFSAQISRVLHLMIHALYTNKDIFLRELISNASDACDKLRYQAITAPELLDDDNELGISIKVDEKLNTLEIKDNGIGMSRAELLENLGTIARSGTMEFLSNMTGDAKKDSSLIGQFGVGFYSSFMVADKVTVTSRKAGEKHGHIWESDGLGEFTIASAGEMPRGTSIVLYLKDTEKEFTDNFKIRHIINTYSDHIAFPISQIIDGEVERVNAGAALWTRQKSEITDEQYQEFYHHVAHSPDKPWLVLHNKAEGAVEYTSLLFVPSLKPFDLFHPERRRRVKLYVKRVFITEENIDLVPHNLRFLRGIIDSADLPLNISRETLQNNPTMKKIRESITLKVLAEINKKAQEDAEGFAKFWDNFGAVLKEGLCEQVPEKERNRLLDICRFYSSTDEKMVSLAEYIARMKNGQEEIYYLTGDNLEALRRSPQLEGFSSRGIEVLLLSDHVDDFWVNVVHEYQGKLFKSATRANIDLDKLGENKTEEDKKETPENSENIDKLIALLKTAYGAEIKDVRTTSKLTETPACLAVDEGDMDFRMERFLMEHKQLPKRAAKILEINPNHPLVILLAERASKDADGADTLDAAQLLLDQARIVEGEGVVDAAAFAKRLSNFMLKGMAA